MASSDQSTSKSAAPSTPAAPLPESPSGADQSDALPSAGAERGDIYGIKSALAAELGQLSDGPTDETTRPGADDSADLDVYDEQAAAQAADELADNDDAAPEPPAPETVEDPDAEAADDAAKANADPESKTEPAKPPEADAAKQKHEVFQARIDELTARAKSAEEQLARQNEQLATYRARDEGLLSPDVLDHVETPEELTQAKQRYGALLNWAIKHPEGGTLGQREYSAEEVRELHAEVQGLVTDAIPDRTRYLEERAKAEAEAVNFYPWLKDTKGGAGGFVQKAIEKIPALRRLPAYRLLAADAFVGQVLRGNGVQMTDKLLARLIEETRKPAAKAPAASTAAAKPRPAVQPPAAPARAGVLPPRQSPRAAAAKVAGQHLRQSAGSEDDLAASIVNKL